LLAQTKFSSDGRVFSLTIVPHEKKRLLKSNLKQEYDSWGTNKMILSLKRGGTFIIKAMCFQLQPCVKESNLLPKSLEFLRAKVKNNVSVTYQRLRSWKGNRFQRRGGHYIYFSAWRDE
jgi:hypothetical protein